MDKLLQKLLEAQVLSEETRKELSEAFQAKLDEAMTAAREEAAAEVRASLTEQWIAERDSLIEALDSQVTDFLQEELTELKADIEAFRDLEAEYAEKIVEAKAEMGKQLETDLKELVEQIDTFLEMRLAEEMNELRGDLEKARKNEFGRRIYEAFASEFGERYVDEAGLQLSINEAEKQIKQKDAQLSEMQDELARIKRKLKMDEVLAPLSGRQRSVMEAILRSVETDRLEEGYKTFIGRVVRETTEEVSTEKEEGVLAESASEGKITADLMAEAKIVSGDREEVIVESASGTNNALKERMQKLAGIK